MDPDYERYHGVHGTSTEVVQDDAGAVTGDERDSLVFRMQFEDGDSL